MFNLGIDIGSTTIKCVVLDSNNKIVFSHYMRHHSDIKKTLKTLILEIKNNIGNQNLSPVITGSGGLALSKYLDFPFLQEVIAVTDAVKFYAPQTDVIVELGGEDAKIVYFDNENIEQRMNGICAGGTGSFIDQMASLIKTDASTLNELAKDKKSIYPIAARCGVFAKTDIQPLINEGASKPDLAASIFKAVVNQTISGLAQGKPIKGNVAFLGGPLHFLSELKNSFIESLNLKDKNVMKLENTHLFAALGCALYKDRTVTTTVNNILKRLNEEIVLDNNVKRLEPLFKNNKEYKDFINHHNKSQVKKGDLAKYKGDLFLGIDAGSTTTKIALIGNNGELLWSFYSSNEGNPLQTCVNALNKLYEIIPNNLEIKASCSTGYGEQLIQNGLKLDYGEVETIAHFRGASFFDPNVDAIIDIGGQDMKCIRIKNNVVDSVQLNEACSSGCGSFIETFATSLDYSVSEFAKAAIKSTSPIDLGTRCTVFMNSKVKQAQKEGVKVEDIASGLAYSVIKNALYKVIKITKASDLGQNIVVQGGTFYNDAVLRAFELITDSNVTRPDIAGIMGAFGAALIARDNYNSKPIDKSTTISKQELKSFKYKTSMTRCKGCNNNCSLTITTFNDKSKFVSGNRCEKGAGKQKSNNNIPNLFEEKNKLLFKYKPLPVSKAYRGTVGIPRVLNIYENYPFWATFFRTLGFRVVLSPESNKQIYELGINSIPSESECYPAKLVHGHIAWLLNQKIDFIFYPCIPYEVNEHKDADNHYNCPIVTSYGENIRNNVEELSDSKIKYYNPFISLESKHSIYIGLKDIFSKNNFNISAIELKSAILKSWNELEYFKEQIKELGKSTLEYMEKNELHGIVLAGRPYHLDPEINHGIPELINSYNMVVFTEDSISHLGKLSRPLTVLDQWMYHTRLYKAAKFVSTRNDLDLVQLNSFGCGLDAITCDQVSDILNSSNKIYTCLKIDEISNLGAARIRIRSLLSALKLKNQNNETIYNKSNDNYINKKTLYTTTMKNENWTILCPQMSPIHFDFIEPAFRSAGYNIKILDNDNKVAVDTGLKYVNNDACYPSLIVVGQIMNAVMSGKYNMKKTAIIITQTGGGCRASNYIGFIRRALNKAQINNVPVISLNVSGLENNPGFNITPKLVIRGIYACIIGDLLMRVLLATRPYESRKGSANKIYSKWKKEGIKLVSSKHFSRRKFIKLCNNIVNDFDNLKLKKVLKPKVGIVGEILVKYSPLANNNLVELLEKEGSEVKVPDLLDFLLYSFYNNDFKYKHYRTSLKTRELSLATISLLEYMRRPMCKALNNSTRFNSPTPITKKAKLASEIVSNGNQTGEGWFLTGEMVELINEGVPNIVCVQPFGCLPNHIVGKGVIKKIRYKYPNSNIVPIDYDPGASEVNQLNRIKLMMTTANRKLDK